MFIGHFGAAFAAKKVSPSVSLGTMILATSFIDLLWPIFLVLGIEHVRVEPGITVVTPLDFYDYPFSHSLLAVVFWSVLLGGLFRLVKKETKGAVLLCFGVLSHWILDFLTHRPDLPLVPGAGLLVGLGLWNSLAATIVVEGAIMVAGVVLYVRSTRALDRTGNVSFWSLVVFLVLVYFANLFGPPPPDVNALGYVGLSMWLFVAWGYWIDRHRSTIVGM